MRRSLKPILAVLFIVHTVAKEEWIDEATRIFRTASRAAAES
jgi:hypothetical protein